MSHILYPNTITKLNPIQQQHLIRPTELTSVSSNEEVKSLSLSLAIETKSVSRDEIHVHTLLLKIRNSSLFYLRQCRRDINIVFDIDSTLQASTVQGAALSDAFSASPKQTSRLTIRLNKQRALQISFAVSPVAASSTTLRRWSMVKQATLVVVVVVPSLHDQLLATNTNSEPNSI